MSLEKGSNYEEKEVPKTVDETIVKYLAFQDAIHPDQKEEQLKQTHEFPKIKEYAQALMDLAQREGMENVENLADTMVGSLQEEAKKLKFQLSRYGEDRSWAMFGLAQEFYNFQHPENFPESERPFLVDPMENSPLAQDKQRDLVHRELAREARREYRQNPEKQNSWRKFVDEFEAFELAYDGLRKEPEDPGEKIKSDELVELGTVLSRIGTNLEHQSEEYETPSISEIIPPGADPEPQKLESPPALIVPYPPKSETLPAVTAPEPQKLEASPKEPKEVKAEEKVKNDKKKEKKKESEVVWGNVGLRSDSKKAKKEEARGHNKNNDHPLGNLATPAALTTIGLAGLAKTFLSSPFESVKGMLSVLFKFLKFPSFKKLSEGVDGKSAAKKPANDNHAHANDNHKKDAGGHGHDKGHSAARH